MNLKDIGNLNSARFLKEAFDEAYQQKLNNSAVLRRNVYLVLFIIGIICIFIAGFAGMVLLSVLSLFLATLSLVVMTKYDTQIFFLNIIQKRDEDSGSDENSQQGQAYRQIRF